MEDFLPPAFQMAGLVPVHRRSLASLPLALVLIVSFMAAPHRLGAQRPGAGAISGTITSSTGAPLSDVTVFAPTLRRGTLTESTGRFHLGGIPAGTVHLVAQRVGLAMDTVSVTLQAGATAQIQLTMREAATVVAPVVVSATRELQRRSEGSVTIDALGTNDIRQTHASHPRELMNRLAGVHVSDLSGEGHSMAIRQPITTKPMFLYLEDGIPTRATGFFNHNALYEVNLPQAAGIEVIKGPGTALYGSDAIGGVVNVLTRSAPLTTSVEASVERGSFGYGRLLASGGSTWGNNGVRADVNVTHGDNWKSEAPFSR
jgi:outer membrane receptor for Fe3+-dicitrate